MAISRYVYDYQVKLIDDLQKNNDKLKDIDRQFLQLIHSFHTYFFHEEKPTDVRGNTQYIVDKDSASPVIQEVERAGIQQDHSHICKFESDSAPGFDLVAEGIERYANDAPVFIRQRWEFEKNWSLPMKEVINGMLVRRL